MKKLLADKNKQL